MSETKSCVLVGVGGQGTILASKILTYGLISAGYDVKMSEIHGMSQRGGSVSTQVRYGEKVYSPIIGEGEADLLVAFEKMEAARAVDSLKPSGSIVVNDYKMPSLPILSGKSKYPENIIEGLGEKADTTSLKANEIALELGNQKCMNVVLLGATVSKLGLVDEIDWDKAIEACVKPRFIELNLKAFQSGINAMN